MRNYYDRELQTVIPSSGENAKEIKIKVVNGDRSTKWLSLNIDSVESFQAFLDIVREDIVKGANEEGAKRYDELMEKLMVLEKENDIAGHKDWDAVQDIYRRTFTTCRELEILIGKHEKYKRNKNCGKK